MKNKRGRCKTLLSELDLAILKNLLVNDSLCITKLMKKIKSGNKDIKKRLDNMLVFNLIRKDNIDKSREKVYSIINRDYVILLIEIFDRK